MQTVTEMSSPQLTDELDWMESYFADCAIHGDGVSTKETARHRAMMLELLKRGIVYKPLDI